MKNKNIQVLDEVQEHLCFTEKNRVSEKSRDWLTVTQIESRIAGLGPTSPAMNHKYKQKPDRAWTWTGQDWETQESQSGEEAKITPKVSP